MLENTRKYGKNILITQKLTKLDLFIRQFKGNYLLLILMIVTFISFFLGEKISSLFIFFMILMSAVLGFWNEYSAQNTVALLLKRISPKVSLIRNSKKVEVDVSEITVEDIVFLSTGSVVPADIQILECEDLEVNESSLTGESFATNKNFGDQIYMGTIIEGGHAVGQVMKIGRDTRYGKIATTTSFVKPETGFQKGLTQFGNLLVKLIIILTIAVFVFNTLIGRDILYSLTFALAIAVGLTPELLPVIVTLSLSKGAGKMSKKHVIVKQLVSIENLGNMDVLCTDKTGTLTEGRINLINYIGRDGEKDTKLLEFAYLTANIYSPHAKNISPIDGAILEKYRTSNIVANKHLNRLDSETFNYAHKASFALYKNTENHSGLFIVKGALEEVLAMCGSKTLDVEEVGRNLGSQGYRTVAVASKIVEQELTEASWSMAQDLEFEGLLIFSDVSKEGVLETLKKLEELGVQIKILTGDNEYVTNNICKEVGMSSVRTLCSTDFEKLTGLEASSAVESYNVFARVTPEQKLQIIQKLQEKGHVVGFLGDGINDAPALHASDVGISVNTAVDVAKEASNIVLLKKGLDVIANGIIEGRKTFSNTVKYILMGTSSNFGNMFSASLSSLVLPFLPMAPVQLLLNNTLYDISQLGVPTDNVDSESLLKPRRWNIDFISKFTMFFGPISSLYDFLTFFILLKFLHFGEAQFQTGWFIESLLTQVFVIFAIRSAKFPFFRSRASRTLMVLSAFVAVLGFVSISPIFFKSLGFAPLPLEYFALLVILVVSYIGLVDIMKILFIKKFKIWN